MQAGIPGQIVEFSYGSQRRQVVTSANGKATVSFPLIGLVGQDVIQVSFAGNAALPRIERLFAVYDHQAKHFSDPYAAACTGTIQRQHRLCRPR